MKSILILFFFVSALSFSLYGEEVPGADESQNTAGQERLSNIHGYARGAVFSGGKIFDYASLFSEFSLKSEFSYGATFMHADIRFQYGLFLGKEISRMQLKEAYAGYRGEKLDIFLGNQIVNWGRTDGFNPTDNLNPIDYFFLSPDMDDQELPSFMGRIRYRLNGIIDFDLIGIPRYAPSVYRYELFDMGENVNFSDPVLPEKRYENGTLAGRINFNFSRLGFSVSAFHGYDPFYGFSLDTIEYTGGTPAVQYIPTPYKKTTLGADFDLALGSWIIRGEAGANLTSDYASAMNIPNPDLSYVLGLEKSFFDVNCIVQYVGKYVYDYNQLAEPVLTDPVNPLAQLAYANDLIVYESTAFNRKIFNQQKAFNHAVSVILSRNFAWDLLAVELAGYYNFTSEEYLIRPKLTWHITDALEMSVGGSWMNGPDSTPFGYSADIMNGAFGELKATF